MTHPRALVGDLRQIAAIRRIVLDDGPERGVRALALSTGGGLDLWALSDRSLDIGPVWWRGIPVAWQSAAGFRSPALHDAEAEGGTGFARLFSGFLVTGGLDHIRQPHAGQPMHGRLPFTPARVLACGEDWDRPEPALFCEAEVIQSRYGGEALRLRRRIEAPVGGARFRIADTVENLGAEAQPHALLYHFNLGFPAIAPGTEVRLGADRLLGPIRLPDPGASRVATCRPAGRDGTACCTVSTPGAEGAFAVTFAFGTATLPFLQTWCDLRPNACVLSVEPCTSDRREDGGSLPPVLLAPGERRRYAVEVSFSGTPAPVTPSGLEAALPGC